MRKILLLLIFLGLSGVGFSQTLTVGTVDPGPYGQGSSIAIPFTVGDPTGNLTTANVFKLYLSDASGSFANEVEIGSYTGFYSTFINGTIPVGAGAGTNYQVRVKSSAPVAVSAASAAFEIKAVSGVVASLDAPSTQRLPGATTTFGYCPNGRSPARFDFTNTSTAGAAVTATLTNELADTIVYAPLDFTSGPQTFTTTVRTHFTVFTKAVGAGGIVGTQAYFIVNNSPNAGIVTSGSGTFCLPAAFTVGVPNNLDLGFPGNTYRITWGDGTATEYYTINMIRNAAYTLNHTYTQSSCTMPNSIFIVELTAISPYCGPIGSSASAQARILEPPVNQFTTTGTIFCTNSAVVFTNTSVTGTSPNANQTCINNNMLYDWYVDGVRVQTNQPQSYNLSYTFTTNGNHTIRLESTSDGECQALPYSMTVCVQNRAVPAFSLPTSTICLTSSLIPTDLSVVDLTCNAANTYTWTVAGPAAVTYLNSTNASSHQPEFKFTQAGTYTVSLAISTPSCGSVSTLTQTVIVNTTPTVTATWASTFCGRGQTLTFSSTSTTVRTVYTGTTTEVSDTYTWTVTGGGYSYASGSTANSKEPSIIFDNFATYTVTVTHKNTCNTTGVTHTGNITFIQAPTVEAGIDQTICPGNTVSLLGVLTDAPANPTFQWSGGTGTFSPSATVLNPTYTPSAADVAAGSVILRLTLTTNNAAPCNFIDDFTTITINPVNTITSAASKAICTDASVAYTPTAVVAGSTFTWTATGSANASGFSPSGSLVAGASITDVITNTDLVNDATVTYIITPTANGCPGTPFTFTVTVKALPIATATTVVDELCSNDNVNIVLTSNQTGSRFTWVSTVSSGGIVTGNSNQSTPSTATSINDVLVNTGSSAATVEYVITPINSTGCPGTPVTKTITVYPAAVIADAGPNQTQCFTTSASLNGNYAGLGTGLWTQRSGPSDVTFADNTLSNTDITGLQAGIYILRWTITGPGACAPTFDDVQVTILSPLAGNSLSTSLSFCGTTSATVTGTTPTGGSGFYTYMWEMSDDGSTNWAVVSGQNQKDITFNITQSVYLRRTVTITSTTCTSTTPAIYIELPTVNAGIDQTICPGSTVSLLGTFTNAPSPVYQWNGGTGTFSPSRNVIDPTYTPSAAEILAGTVTLRLTLTTTNPTPCNLLEDAIVITIYPVNTITSPSLKSICTAAAVNYAPASSVTGSTFTWTATGSTNATGFSATGSLAAGASITDIITNTDLVADATVTYIITPTANSCPGTPFTFTVTVSALPIATATVPNDPMCTNQNVNIALASNQTGTKFMWTSSVSGGTVTGTSNQTTAITATSISNVLINTGTTPDTVTYVITPVNATGCIGASVTKTVVVYPTPVTANAGINQSLCFTTSVTLGGNNTGYGTGQWTLTSGPASVTFVNDALNNTVVNGLQAGIYIFKWTISGPGSCAATNDEVQIVILPVLADNTLTTASSFCENSSAQITGSTPTGGTGTYTYSWERSSDGTTNWSTLTESGQNITLPVVTQTFYLRRTVTSATCTLTSSVIEVLVLPSIANNIISADQLICINTAPNQLTGTAPSGGDGSYSYQWEQSIDNGLTWATIVSADQINYQPGVLPRTTNFRRIVTSNVCYGAQQNISAAITVAVTQPIANFTWTNDSGCTPFILTAQNIVAQNTTAPDNDQYHWFADGTPIGTGSVFPGYTIQNGQSVLIKLEVTSRIGCTTAVFSHTFTTTENVVADFISDKAVGCGPMEVQFTNRSTGTAGATYRWDFGNGEFSALSTPNAISFEPRTDGKDSTYFVKLTVTTPCKVVVKTMAILIHAKPVSIFSPSQTTGCSPFNAVFNNTSKGDGSTYYWDFGDGTTLTTTNPAPVSHVYNTPIVKTYIVKLTAENSCGSSSSSYTIRVTANTVIPQLIVNGDELFGCAPFTVTFNNNTIGALFYSWDFNDGRTLQTNTSPQQVKHTFTKGGVYVVRFTASNGCSDSTITKTITVYPQAEAKFFTDVQSGCRFLTVQFHNSTINGFAYNWDFGDGTTSVDSDPVHTFSYRPAPYTVKLIAMSSLGCPDTIIMKDYIRVNPAPVAKFEIGPDSVLNAPRFKFSFTDKSAGTIASRRWDFGDNSISTFANPEHTYADTGFYQVTLIVTSNLGCMDTVQRTVHISNLAGTLFLPNAFLPNSQTEDLRTFKAKGMGLKEWRMSIFNKWGQEVWYTTKIDYKGSPEEGWDGTINGTPSPQGIYIWNITATFENGTNWPGLSYNSEPPKRTGAVYLIR